MQCDKQYRDLGTFDDQSSSTQDCTVHSKPAVLTKLDVSELLAFLNAMTSSVERTSAESESVQQATAPRGH